MYKTLFLGSNWEALETLKILHGDKRFEIAGVITQPDKPVGRKKIVTPTEIKQYCVEHGIPVFHTEKSKSRYKEALEKFAPELVVCKSFGEMIPEFFLEAPKFSAINVHYSLLPKYRGAIPIQKAILDGEKVTGISIVQMTKELDAGKVLARYEEAIRDDDTNFSLRKRLVQKTGEVLPDILEKWCKGEIPGEPQDDALATYCYQEEISKENAFIDWTKESAISVDRKVRAFLPWPVAWSFFKGKRIKIFKVAIAVEGQEKFTSMTETLADNLFIAEGRLFAKTVDGTIEILELQLEGKEKIAAKDAINGMRRNSQFTIHN